MKYELLQKNIETADPKNEAEEIYKSLMDKEPKGCHSLEIPVMINGVNYTSIHCAYNGGGMSDEIVLAERRRLDEESEEYQGRKQAMIDELTTIHPMMEGEQ